MQTAKHIATHLSGVYFGGNWTFSNLKEHLTDLSWQQATQQVSTLNTIATLVFHIGYFVNVATKVLEGGPLEGNDKFSFQHPPIESQEDWEQFLARTYAAAEQFAKLVEQLPDEKLWEVFSEEKYGNYYRNLHGIIEHAHYHLGQIVLIKKLILQAEK